jgi:hypothetical protein
MNKLMILVVSLLLINCSIDTLSDTEKALRTEPARFVASEKFSENIINEEGLVSVNQSSWVDAGIQGEGSYWCMITAIQNGDTGLIDKSLKAIEVTITHSNGDGTFEATDDKGNARFIVFSLASITLLEDTDFYQNYSQRISDIIYYLQDSAQWYYDIIHVDPGIENTNYKFSAAFVLLKVGYHINDNTFINLGEQYLSEALNNQDEDGYYLEEGGYDTSYQMVSVYLLYFIYHIQDCDSGCKSSIMNSLQLAYEWESDKIESNGKVSDEGNTRTANNISDSPENKLINYYEVILSFCYLYGLGFDGALSYAELVTDYLKGL